ncbi:HNH endonuclease signature motif containing protein [Mesoplasma tabanidae]|uniref:HNH endonuclease n=1 Tax=Mesoplasma tabanidae TaxID=219745 RepID=A0A2K8P456_9MOLU|nr:HNH endonuclease signature motif containing protein [Mesoplasma tabanidae]ATZ21529.1 HNH endonuclease [Mesoplasma tabanidae]
MEKNKNKYQNFWNGKVIQQDDSEFQEIQADSLKVVDSLIREIAEDGLFQITGISSKINNKFKQNDEHTLNLNYMGNHFKLNLVKIKNSGIEKNHNKRLHIKVNKEINDEPFFLLGILNIGDDYISTLSNRINEKYKNKIKHAKNSKNNSSWWIGFENIKKIVNSKSEIAEENTGLRTFIFDPKLVINLLKNNLENFKFNKGTTLDSLFLDDFVDLNVDNLIPDFNYETDVLNLDNKIKLKRDHNLVLDFLKKNQICFICKTTDTFINRSNGLKYFEVHHFIPYNYETQMNYKKTLDSELNLISLCPLCHRKIHLSEEIEAIKIIEEIYFKKVDPDFIKIYKESDLTKIIEQYKNTFNFKE